MATNGDNGPSVFAKYIDHPQQAPAPSPTPLATPPEALKLLNWLQNTWTKPTIRARDIYQYGPRPIRNKESTLKSTEILERRGWLIPLKTPRYDAKRWQITIGPP
jgi:hypothetical protein